MNTTCPDTGRLRAWLDRDSAITDTAPLDDHLATCDACREALVELEDDATHMRDVLAAHVGPAPSAEETEVALGRLHTRLSSEARSGGLVALTPRPHLPIVGEEA